MLLINCWQWLWELGLPAWVSSAPPECSTQCPSPWQQQAIGAGGGEAAPWSPCSRWSSPRPPRSPPLQPRCRLLLHRILLANSNAALSRGCATLLPTQDASCASTDGTRRRLQPPPSFVHNRRNIPSSHKELGAAGTLLTLQLRHLQDSCRSFAGLKTKFLCRQAQGRSHPRLSQQGSAVMPEQLQLLGAGSGCVREGVLRGDTWGRMVTPAATV